MWPRTRVALNALSLPSRAFRNGASQAATRARQFSSSAVKRKEEPKFEWHFQWNDRVWSNRGGRQGGGPGLPPNKPSQGGGPNQKEHPVRLYIGGAVVVVGGVYYVSHLERVPETGRLRFIDISESIEARLGVQMLNNIMHEHGSRMLPPHHPVSQHVTDVVRHILAASDLGHLRGESPIAPAKRSDARLDVEGVEGTQKEWTVHVVADDTPNAFTTFGGHIVVFTGILPFCDGQDGLAAVLGHEIGHVVARHPSEKISLGKVITVLVYALGFFGIVPIDIASFASEFLLSLPNSRVLEYEADRIGLKLMARACYDPRASPAVFTRLAEMEERRGARSLEFLQTHPQLRKRVEILGQYIPEALMAQEENGLCNGMAQQLGAFGRTVRRMPLPPPPPRGGHWGGNTIDDPPPERGPGGELIWK